jgi:hypothetical protein
MKNKSVGLRLTQYLHAMDGKRPKSLALTKKQMDELRKTSKEFREHGTFDGIPVREWKDT